MTTTSNSRMKMYGRGDMMDAVAREQLDGEDMSFLAAISTFAMVAELPGMVEPKLAGLRTVDIPVFDVTDHPTGIFQEVGQQSIIFINGGDSLLDYDFISELHPQHDWDVYLWMSCPWRNFESDIGLYGEWYRRDVYPDGMLAYDGKMLGWEDLPAE